VVPLADNVIPTLDQFVRPQVDVEQALIQWVVQTRQPFTVVEHPAFKAIFQAVKADLPIKSADTLYNRVGKKFVHGRDHLKQELGANCRTIALSLDVWTSEHQLAILGVIGHWITPGFDRREELLEFTEIQGPHSGENLAEIVLTMLDELEIAPKLLTITGDNAGNNGTLCEALQSELLKTYDDKDDPFRMKPLMRFRGRESFIPCLAHVINLICKEILVTLKAGSIREAKALLDEIATQREPSFASTHTTKSAVVKIRLLTLWIARSPQRRQEWKKVSPDKQVRYDVDNRWNSTYLMIADAVRLRRELTQFVRTHADVQAFQLTEHDWLTLQQLGNVLKPFWDHTNMVSKACPTIVESLPIYWHLDDLLDDIQGARGDFEGVNGDIRAAVEWGIRKMNKFARLMDDNILYYVAAVLDPRIKTSLIQAQMSEPDAQLIISQVREFLKKQYPFVPALPSTPDRPPGMPETIWRTLQKVQPPHGALMSDIDRYLGSQPVNWSHHLIEDGDSAWVLKWWKMNASEFPLMAQAVRDYSPVPSAEVGVERLFSDARDVLGLRRHRMNAETMRRLMLLKGHYDKKSSD
jgi:hypothetical protein